MPAGAQYSNTYVPASIGKSAHEDDISGIGLFTVSLQYRGKKAVHPGME
jgi:hypothetical protein